MCSSVAMKTEGLQRCLSNVLSSGLQIESIATDRHTSVGALMKKKYPHIEHQYDVWHLAKCIGKKLMQKGITKKCEKLLPWIQSITNHLWWCAQTCNKVLSYCVQNGYPLCITYQMSISGEMVMDCLTNVLMVH